jgi:hypothetical protein
MFLDPRFKYLIATDNEEFCNNVEIWIDEEINKEMKLI